MNYQYSAAEVQNAEITIYRKELQSLEDKMKRFEDGGKNVVIDSDLKEKITIISLKANEYEQKLVELQNDIQEKKCCKICMEEDISIVFLPCGHLCCCSNCANHPSVKKCPTCRGEIKNKFKVFL